MPDSPGGRPGIGRVALSVVVGAAGLGLSSRYFAPLPVPALTALVGGLLVYWLAGAHRLARTVLGMILGAVPGAVIHHYMHYAEGRLEPAEGLWVHIGLDVATGLAVAASILVVVAVLDHVLARRSQPGKNALGGK